MKTITKEVSWNAAHRLYNPAYDIEWNKATFGPCFNLHGHLYKLFVTVTTFCRSEDDGFIINFKVLKDIINKKVVQKYDHKLLLHESDPFVTLLEDRTEIVTMDGVTSCENQVHEIWKQLYTPLKIEGIVITEIKLYETPTSYCTYNCVAADEQ